MKLTEARINRRPHRLLYLRILSRRAAFPQKFKNGGIPPRLRRLIVNNVPVGHLEASLLSSWETWVKRFRVRVRKAAKEIA